MKYRQDRVTHELIPIDEWMEKYGETTATHMVMGDIEPYQSMIDGTLITSRNKHRAHLREHGCIEVGNETQHLIDKAKPMKEPPGLKRQLIEAFNRKGY